MGAVALLAITPAANFAQNPGAAPSQGSPAQIPAGAAQNPGDAGRNQGLIPTPDPNINLNAGRLFNPGEGRGNRPERATPRHPDGRVNLGPAPGERGVWEGNAGAVLATHERRAIDNPRLYLPTNKAVKDVPFQPWARAVYEYRQAETTKDDPHVRCKASGGPRMFHTPYGLEFLELPEEGRMIVTGVGGPHTWRVIYMDGRPHPADLDPSFSGHSTGRWEGDTLVIDAVGFNEKFWLTREGIPHTEKLHLIERFTRTDYYTLKYEATIDDPGAYTEPWTGGWILEWRDAELYEYVCQENNRDPEHMFGGSR
jgi:hypothetical protein